MPILDKDAIQTKLYWFLTVGMMKVIRKLLMILTYPHVAKTNLKDQNIHYRDLL